MNHAQPAVEATLHRPVRTRRRPLALTLLAGLVIVLTAFGTTAPAQAATDLRSYFVDRINAVRAAAGVGPVVERAELDAFAQQQSARMQSAGTLFHTVANPTDASVWGQNIGYGPCPCTVQHAFELSPAHAANIRNPAFREVGIGLVQDGSGTWWVTQQFAG